MVILQLTLSAASLSLAMEWCGEYEVEVSRENSRGGR